MADFNDVSSSTNQAKSPAVNRVCVFAHYDPDNRLDPHVHYFLTELSNHVDRLILVSTCELEEAARRQLADIGAEFYLRENIGFDFGSYQYGLSQLALTEIDELILCNDSVYGPLRDFADVFQQMADSPADFWGITSSEEISFHLQSYFLVFRKPVLVSDAFSRFWNTLAPGADKQQIILDGEVGLSRVLLAAGFHSDQLVSTLHQPWWKRIANSAAAFARRFRRRWREAAMYRHLVAVLLGREKLAVNPTQLEWRQLLVAGTPFVKVELLRCDPLGIAGREEILTRLARQGDYPTTLIRAHLERLQTR